MAGTTAFGGVYVNATAQGHRLTQEGSFVDADGRSVEVYDDVSLLTPLLIENMAVPAVEVPAGTIGTVLFHCGDSEGPLTLELYWPEGSFVFGYGLPTNVRLYRTAEQKHAHLC